MRPKKKLIIFHKHSESIIEEKSENSKIFKDDV